MALLIILVLQRWSRAGIDQSQHMKSASHIIKHYTAWNTTQNLKKLWHQSIKLYCSFFLFKEQWSETVKFLNSSNPSACVHLIRLLHSLHVIIQLCKKEQFRESANSSKLRACVHLIHLQHSLHLKTHNCVTYKMNVIMAKMVSKCSKILNTVEPLKTDTQIRRTPL